LIVKFAEAFLVKAINSSSSQSQVIRKFINQKKLKISILRHGNV